MTLLHTFRKYTSISTSLTRLGAGILTRGGNYYNFNLINLTIRTLFFGLGIFAQMRMRAFHQLLTKDEAKKALRYELISAILVLLFALLIFSMVAYRIFGEQTSVFD